MRNIPHVSPHGVMEEKVPDKPLIVNFPLRSKLFEDARIDLNLM